MYFFMDCLLLLLRYPFTGHNQTTSIPECHPNQSSVSEFTWVGPPSALGEAPQPLWEQHHYTLTAATTTATNHNTDTTTTIATTKQHHYTLTLGP